jgi:hypothetical protein
MAICSKCGARFEEAEACPNCGELQLQGVDAYERLVIVSRKLIKEDDFTIRMVLSHCFSAYIPEPLNLLSEGESSMGKTYPIVTICDLFPQEDVWPLAGMSPTALAHDHGELVDADTNKP